MSDHDKALAQAFDGQAARFERAPTQADPAALARLVAFADLPPRSHILDAGCGPGLVAEAFLGEGHSVHGIDLSAQMLARARQRCARFGERASFAHGSLLGMTSVAFDAAVSRFVIHHAGDALAFLRAQVDRVRAGGVVVACDHVTDPDVEAARWHQDIERARDGTHTRNLTSGEMIDAMARVGLVRVRMREEEFELDFDEWFDRGTPALDKADVRRQLLAGTARGFAPHPRDDGGISLRCVRTLVRGEKA